MRLSHVLALAPLTAVLLLSGCAQSIAPSAPVAPLKLEALGQALPSSPAREGWIDQIINQDPAVVSSLKPVLQPTVSNDERIARLRKQDGGVLPDAYWALYKQNLEAMQYDLNHRHDAAREQYTRTYRDELSRLSDSTLQAMATTPQGVDANTRRQLSARMSDRTATYLMTSEQSFKDATDAHLNRMALMDRQYNVCARKPDCWDAPVKK
ncbi:hypothetical protein [Pseudomonas costantinii]|uniref:hypothetical protein n=1 Tax=Pseudomonas costantinii TaxID=168469 RepID=UPI0015A2FC49|nr:hypothetical protein [Pseudomonas costantinii]NVZ71756.1 hypothetical protein [Pseudomonas costantinii]